MIIIRLVGGIHDGVEIPWPSDAVGCPTAFEFEDEVYDRHPDQGATWRESLWVMMAAKSLGVKRNRYEFECMEDEGRWNYALVASRWVGPTDDGNPTPGA